MRIPRPLFEAITGHSPNLLILMFLLSEGRAGEVWGPSK